MSRSDGTCRMEADHPYAVSRSYPALHIYLYSALSWLTDRGKHLERAQWTFAGVYLATMAVVLFGIYRRNKQVSPTVGRCSLFLFVLEGPLSDSWRNDTRPTSRLGATLRRSLFRCASLRNSGRSPSNHSARRADPSDKVHTTRPHPPTDPALGPPAPQHLETTSLDLHAPDVQRLRRHALRLLRPRPLHGACLFHLEWRAGDEAGGEAVVVRDSLAQVRCACSLARRFTPSRTVQPELTPGNAHLLQLRPVHQDVDLALPPRSLLPRLCPLLPPRPRAAPRRPPLDSSLALLPLPPDAFEPNRLPLTSVRFRPCVRVGVHRQLALDRTRGV